MGILKHGFPRVVLLYAVSAICIQANSLTTLTEKELEQFQAGIIPIYRYENPIDRDRFIWTGPNVKTKFSNFNFNDYHFDGFIANVVSKQAYERVIAKKEWATDMMLPIYHGYHEDMKHNYFSKPWEYYFEGPVFYCARKKGFANSKSTLWTLDGQPIDKNENLGYDTIYTTRLIERDLPNVEDYVMYRILCYTWDDTTPRPAPVSLIVKELQSISTPYIHNHWRKLIPLYQFFNEHDQDHYYQARYKGTPEEYAKLQNRNRPISSNSSL